MIQKLTFAYAVFFVAVVASGWFPPFIVWGEDTRLLFGLFELTTVDDITHGFTALALIIAAFTSRQLCLMALTVFGSYYALDAIFYLINGFFNTLPWMSDILLNLPHVLLSTTMFAIVYILAKKHV